MTLKIGNNPALNPKRLPWQSRVPFWHLGYHKTEEAARRAAQRAARAAAREYGNGYMPEWEVRQVIFTD